ncbi:MAG: hypothetical protein PWR24_670 [Desulfonauticus sp.]|jgi:diguanylate cyclase (GGDEF)-like protein/PAS domain S-box-containing protein|nr:MAG: Diguanylate cyclase with PAS/PAC sensor [Desulfonauticus sp. 38_4375]MDK2921113.1 hypothetical protein [Desulfonauticus sp.]
MFLEDACTKILDNLWEGAYLLDEDRTIVYWNRGAEIITGYTQKEVVGRHCRDNILVHIGEDGRELCKEICPALISLRKGVTKQNKAYLQHKKGYRVGVKIKTFPVYIQDKKYVLELFQESYDDYFVLNHFEKLAQSSLLDPLTGLPNRRYLLTKLEENINLFKRYNFSFGVIFLDIDNFKLINDTYGHGAGDEVLKVLGKTLQNLARKGDVFGRFGGEEFLGLVIVKGLKELQLVANRLRVIVEHSKAFYQDKVLRFTISVGATLVSPEDTSESIVERADRLMYLAKKEGKNRVVVG